MPSKPSSFSFIRSKSSLHRIRVASCAVKIWCAPRFAGAFSPFFGRFHAAVAAASGLRGGGLRRPRFGGCRLARQLPSLLVLELPRVAQAQQLVLELGAALPAVVHVVVHVVVVVVVVVVVFHVVVALRRGTLAAASAGGAGSPCTSAASTGSPSTSARTTASRAAPREMAVDAVSTARTSSSLPSAKASAPVRG